MKNEKELKIEKKILENNIELELRKIINHLKISSDLFYRYDNLLDNDSDNHFYDDYKLLKSYDELYLDFQKMIDNHHQFKIKNHIRIKIDQILIEDFQIFYDDENKIFYLNSIIHDQSISYKSFSDLMIDIENNYIQNDNFL